jgi:hypothetical protein
LEFEKCFLSLEDVAIKKNAITLALTSLLHKFFEENSQLCMQMAVFNFGHRGEILLHGKRSFVRPSILHTRG